MRYFVTGGTGFIGQQVVQQLAEEGHEVIILVRDEARAQTLITKGVNVVIGDITGKESMVER